MASDDLEMDWGDDPFGGDIDFDMDFDSGEKKGRLRSLATGFLSGLKANTIGDTDARIKTLRMALPKSFSGAFNALNEFNTMKRAVIEELKTENAQAVQDAQYIVGRSLDKLRKFAPNKIADKAEEFSKHDFSHWADNSSSGSDDARIQQTTDDDIRSLLQATQENAVTEQGILTTLGETITTTLGEMGGRQIGALHAANQNLGQLSVHLKQIVSFQQRVQAKNDALKINLLARMHVTSAKYYKFSEAAHHRQIKELKELVKYGKMSDYEKTSTSQAAKNALRNNFFNTAASKFGGIRNAVVDMVGRSRRKEMSGELGGILGDVRMGMEMTDGMDLNLWEMAGEAASGFFIDKIPELMKSDKGRALAKKLAAANPKFAAKLRRGYRKLGDWGNTASYAANNVEGIVNTLAKNYTGFDFDDVDDYEEYVDRLPPGQKPMNKQVWTMLNMAKKTGKKGLGNLLDNTYASTGTSYNIQKRSLLNNDQVHAWTIQSHRTLNEIIPQWFSHIHLSLEKMRTGNDALKADHYDFVKGKFISNNEAKKMTAEAVFNRRQFTNQADMAKGMAKNIDKSGALSPAAQNALSLQLAKDADQGLGFVPYNYIDLEKQGVNKKIAEEIRQMIKANFGITDDHINTFKSGSDVDRLKLSTYLPSKEGRELAVNLSESAKSLSGFMPDVVNQFDALRNSGYYDVLRQNGIIKSQNGVESIDKDLFWNNLGKIIEDKNAPLVTPEAEPDRTTREFGKGGNTTNHVNQNVTNTINLGPLTDALSSITNTFNPDMLKHLNGLTDSLSGLSTTLQKGVIPQAPGIDMSPMITGVDATNSKLDELLKLANNRNDILEKILLRQGGPIVGEGGAKPDEVAKRMDRQKKGLLDRIKAFSPRNMFNKGVDLLMRNDSLIMGGMLGGLAGLAIHDPKMAMLVGAGGLAATAYSKLHQAAKVQQAADDQDLYEEGSETPILEARKLKNGDYYDLTKKAIVRSWIDIVGTIKDIATGVLIPARKLAQKLFGPDGREVFLKGLNKVRNAMVKLFNVIDPFGRMGKFKNAITTRFNQMDVYKEGEKAPVLIGKKFKTGQYWKMDKDGKTVQLKGWNEIDGPVFDRDGECLITQEDYDRGLKTSMGVSINKLGEMSSKLGAFGLDFLGRTKDAITKGGISAFTKTKELVKADYAPVISSIDRIYALLSKHFNLEIDPEVAENLGKKAMDALSTSGEKKLRQNSLADKAEQAKAEKESKVKDSIISIAGSLSGDGEKDTGEKKKKGLFGMLSSVIGGIFGIGKWGLEKIIGPTFTNGFKTLFKFAHMGLKVFPLIGSGIASTVKGIAWLGKGLFNLLGGNGQGDSLIDKIKDSFGGGEGGGGEGGGSEGETAEERRRARRDRRRSRTRRGRRQLARERAGSFLKGGVKSLGTAAAVSFASNALASSGIIDEDGAAASVLDGVGTAANAYGIYSTVAGAAGMAGVDLSLGAMAGMAGTGLAAAGSGVATAATVLAPLLLNPITLTIAAGVGIGYLMYKGFTRGKGKQYDVRMTQYGLSDVDSDLAKKIQAVEKELANYVVISNGRASFAKEVPLQKLFQVFINNPDDKKELGDFFTWFNGRFKPVFLVYMASLDTMKLKTLAQYDDTTNKDVYLIAKQVHQTLGTIEPYPYSIVTKIDKDVPLLDQQSTIARVNDLLDELKSYVDRYDHTTTAAEYSTNKFHAEGKTGLEEEKKKLQAQLAKPTAFGWFGGTTDLAGAGKARARLKYIDGELNRLNEAYKPGTVAGDIDISDMYKADQPLDLLTAIRVAAYGNDESIPWRVEAVLKLERYVEQKLRIIGKDVRFTGKTGEIYNAFKGAFRIEKKDADEWCTWFRDRFLPVLMTYVKVSQEYRRGLPGATWRGFTATAKYEIGRSLSNVTTLIDGDVVPVWEVKDSPFGGWTRSTKRPGRVDSFLAALSVKAKEAKLKDPMAEAANTSAKSFVATDTAHKVGGAPTPYAPNNGAPDSYRNRADQMRGTSYGSSGGNDMGGTFSTAGSMYSNAPIEGNSDLGSVNTAGTTANAGSDQGVTVPKKAAEQLIIKEMLRQGFKDPRQIALMLALCNYESGGFTKTTENMNYTDPARMVKMFREVHDVEQAKRLIAAGPVAIANTVYGGAKGAGLGNIQQGDGWLFRGRGFVQLTGRDNFRRIGQQIGVDLENNPKLASEDPITMAKIAVNFFKNSQQLQSIAQTNNFENAARGLNGGLDLPGMSERNGLFRDYLAQLNNGELKPDGGAPGTENVNPATGLPTDGGLGNAAATPNGAPSPSGSPAPTAPGALPPGLAKPGTFAPPPGGGLGNGGTGGGGMQNYSNAGASFTPTMNAVDQATGNRTNDYSGLNIKSNESVAGGPIHPGLKRAAELFQKQIPNFARFTAFNDAYHQTKPGNSKHKVGLALDLTLNNGAAGAPGAIQVIHQIMASTGMAKQDYYVLDEYRNTTANTTGGHVHFNFNSDEAANKFLGKAGPGLTPPAGVQSPTAGDPSMSPQIPTAPQAPGAAPAAADPMAAIPSPMAPPTAAAPAPMEAPTAPPMAAPAPAAPAAQAPLDMNALAEILGKAVASGEAGSQQLLSQILDELKKANKSGSSGPSVRMN